MSRESFVELLKCKDVKYDEKYDISRFSTVRIGAREFTVFPKSQQELICCLDYLEDNREKYTVVGAMSNTLARSDGYGGVIICTSMLDSWSLNANTVTLSAGCRIARVAPILADVGLSGFEELVGIPGYVGGLVYGNAGAFARSISDVLLSAEIYDTATRRVMTFSREEMKFSYRRSILSENRALILISATLGGFEKRGRDEILKKISDCAARRREAQPLEYPSLGSVFKRPAVGYAGAYIEDAGLKGYSVGGATVSKKHAGFIINSGGCTSDDFISLLEYVQRTVFERYGVLLEREVEYLQ